MQMSLKKFFIFFLPALIFGALLYYGVFWNIYIALTNYSLLHPVPEFTGLYSFMVLFNDYEFQMAFERTMLWVAVLVVLGNIVGLLIATAIFQLESPKLRNALTALFVYPMSLSMIVVGIMWRWIFDPYKGIDVVLKGLGIGSIDWLTGYNAFWSLSLVSVWVYAGFSAMLYLAAFYNVDRSIIESAMVDGADTFTIMTRIVIPNSRQGLLISTIFLALFAIQMFALPYAVLFLNPFTETMVMYVYNKFVSQYFFLASAAAIIIIVVSAFIVIPYAMYGLKKWIVRR